MIQIVNGLEITLAKQYFEDWPVSIKWPLPKKCPYSEFFWSIVSRIWTEHEWKLRISPYLVQMQENIDQKNSEYGHFVRSGQDLSFSKTGKISNHSKHVRDFSIKRGNNIFSISSGTFWLNDFGNANVKIILRLVKLTHYEEIRDIIIIWHKIKSNFNLLREIYWVLIVL